MAATGDTTDAIRGITCVTVGDEYITMIFGPGSSYIISFKIWIGPGDMVNFSRLTSFNVGDVREDHRKAVGEQIKPLLQNHQIVEALKYLRREFPEDSDAAPGIEDEDDEENDIDFAVFQPGEYDDKLGDLSYDKKVLLVSYGNSFSTPPALRGEKIPKISALSFNGRGPRLSVLRGTDEELQQRVISSTQNFTEKFGGVLEKIGKAIRGTENNEVVIGIFCSKGHHRSVSVAELSAKVLKHVGVDVETRHPHLWKR